MEGMHYTMLAIIIINVDNFLGSHYVSPLTILRPIQKIISFAKISAYFRSIVHCSFPLLGHLACLQL